jgi:hypothetical protein
LNFKKEYRMMSKTVFYLLPLVFSLAAGLKAQVSMGKNELPHPSAMLDMDVPVTDRVQGVLFPRIPLGSAADRTSIPSPDDYLLVFSSYTAPSSYVGLSYWHNSRWHRLLNQTDLFDSISAHYIAQIVLYASQTAPEGQSHVTDPANRKPYKLSIDKIVFDSQNSYKNNSREYVIPENGLYEIACSATLSDVQQSPSMQTFICVDGVNVMNDLVNNSPSTVSGTVVYIAFLNKGQHVYGAVGVGTWNNPSDSFRVTASSLTITKY